MLDSIPLVFPGDFGTDLEPAWAKLIVADSVFTRAGLCEAAMAFPGVFGCYCPHQNQKMPSPFWPFQTCWNAGMPRDGLF